MEIEQNPCLRPDGRSSLQLRPIGCKFSQISTCSGSAVFGFGDCEVLSIAIGPTCAKYKDEIADRAFMEVTFKNPRGSSSTADKMNEKIIQDLLKTIIIDSSLLRTCIKLTIHVFQESSATLAVAINSAVLSLVDAEIPIKCLVAALTCIINEDNQVILDPIDKEIECARSFHTFAFESLRGNLVTDLSVGKFSKNEHLLCYEVCKNASTLLFDFYRKSIARKVEWDIC